jgi:ubiquinone biosynthesis protein
MDSSPASARPTQLVAPSDWAIGSFTETAPWLVDPDAMPWRTGIVELRRRVRGGVPALVSTRHVPPVGRMATVVGQIGAALGAWQLVERRHGGAESRAGLSRRLRIAFSNLGPTFIKLGQIISAGDGIFPAELVAEFRLCRDRMPAEPFAVVRATIEAELGGPLERFFAHVEPEPVAAASIAQVHRARLIDGTDVVVKVQRSEVDRVVRRDLAVLAWLSPLLVGRIPVAALANPPALVELFAETIVEELDFRLEAENMLDIARVLAACDQRALVVPRPHPTLVSRRVLVMERLDGFGWTEVERMRAAGIDTTAVLRSGLIGFLEGAVLYGVFHGDLHPGNLVVLADGRVGLLDHGITGRLDQRGRLAFLRLLVAATANDPRSQLAALRDLGALPSDVDLDQVLHDLGFDRPPRDPLEMSPDELVAEIREMTKSLLGYGARMPKELMLFVKNMLFLDEAVATMAPDIDVIGEVLRLSAYFTERHGSRIAADIGIDPTQIRVDTDGLRAALGVVEPVDRITYRELQERRELMRKRMESHRRQGGRERRRPWQR